MGQGSVSSARKDIVVDVRAKDYLSKKLQALSSYLEDLAKTIEDLGNILQRTTNLVHNFKLQFKDLKDKADKIDELFEIKIEDSEGGHK